MTEDLNNLSTRSPAENDAHLTACEDAYAACEGAHAIAVMTEWDQFRDLDWQRIYQSMTKPPLVFDGRNLLDRQTLVSLGFTYCGIGT